MDHNNELYDRRIERNVYLEKKTGNDEHDLSGLLCMSPKH